MYSIYADGVCIYNDSFAADSTKAVNPKLTLEKNTAGSLSITLPAGNAGYSMIQRLVTDISVRKEGKEIWAGRVLSESRDFWNNRVLYCEGELAFFNDSVQPPAEYAGCTIREYLEALIAVHNEKVDASRRFSVDGSAVSVYDGEYTATFYTNYTKTIDALNELVDAYGGHFRIRKENGTRYLDYLSDYPDTCRQTIQFGKNLIDFTRSWDSTQFATVIIPLGKRLENSKRSKGGVAALDEYLTIADENEGSVYLQSPDAVESYGRIEKVVSFSDIDDPKALKERAEAYLRDLQFEDMTIELSALDLHYLNAGEDAVELLDEIQVISRPHGMNRLFPVTKLVIPLDSPEKTQFTLGGTVRNSLTAASGRTSTDILRRIDALPKAHSVLDEARANAAAILNLATTGYITITRDENGSDAFYISNIPDYKNADKFWKWNMNGLAYYEKAKTDMELTDSNGYAILDNAGNGIKSDWIKLALTMDGQIVADYITTGTMSADRIRAGVLRSINDNVVFDLDNGKLVMNRGSIRLGNYSNDSKHYQFEVNEDGTMYAGGSAIFAGKVYAQAFYDKNGELVFHDGRIDESYLNLDELKLGFHNELSNIGTAIDIIPGKIASVVYEANALQTIDLFGYGDDPPYDAAEYSGKRYMNVLNGKIYRSDGTEWRLLETETKQTRFLQDLSGFQFVIAEGEEGITYSLTKDGFTISANQKRQYSLTGDQNGTWYDSWDDSCTGKAVYARNSYDGGQTWGAVYVFQGLVGKDGDDGSNGKDAYTVILNNNPHVFAGGVDHAVAGNVTVGILAFKGDTRVAATIGTIANNPTGMTTRLSNNGTINASFTVNVATTLSTPSGTLTVPVTVDGKSFTLYWSWSIAFKGAKGETGEPGSNANVDFNAVNNALGELFKDFNGGKTTTMADSYIYSPNIKGGNIYGCTIYAGQGTGYSQMSQTGLDVYDSEKNKKIGMGWASGATTYPYIMLGQGTGYTSSGAGIIQKLGNGVWIGDSAIANVGGNYPGGVSSVSDISESYGEATGIFIDFTGDKIYKYINGVPTEIGSGGGSGTLRFTA